MLKLFDDFFVFLALEAFAGLLELLLLLFVKFVFALAQQILDLGLGIELGCLLRLVISTILVFRFSISVGILRVLQRRDLLSNSLLFASSDRLLKHFLEDLEVVTLSDSDLLTACAFNFNPRGSFRFLLVAFISLILLLSLESPDLFFLLVFFLHG